MNVAFFTSRRRANLIRLGIAGCGVAALAACGGSPSAGAAKSTPPPKPPSEAQLQKMMLRPSDLGAGWKAITYRSGSDDKTQDAQMDRCAGGRDTDSDELTTVNSKEFDRGAAAIVSEATSYRSAADVTSDAAMLRSPKIAACFQSMLMKMLTDQAPKGVKVDSVHVKVTPGQGGGPSNVAGTLTGTVAVGLPQGQVTMYASVIMIEGPLVEATVMARSVNEPVPASVVDPLVAIVSRRVRQG